MKNQINILTVCFNNEINREEIPLFRGAVIDAVKDSDAVLFHNHIDNKLRYKYPLIQYKRIRQKAAIVCLKEGAEEIGELFKNFCSPIKIGKREVQLEVGQLKASRSIIQIWDDEFDYYIRNWLPLNAANYEKFEQLEGLVEQTQFLEKILTANILSFCKGLDIHLDQQVTCKILQIDERQWSSYKGVKMLSFGGIFRTNVSLPDYAGIGKGVSLGHGVVVRKHGKKNEDDNE